MKKHFKKILTTLLILVVVAFGFVGNYFYNFGLNPKVDKGAIVNQDSDGSKEDKTALNKWFDEKKQTVEMESITKNKLVGYKFVNLDSEKWIFVVHGYTSDAKKMVNYIKNFFGDVDATKALKETKLPALVLHGEEDGFVPLEHGKAAYDLITSEKEFHSFPGMKHVQAERKFREQYWNIVGEFLKKHFE